MAGSVRGATNATRQQAVQGNGKPAAPGQAMLSEPEASLRITFAGKDNARQLARKVRPRVLELVRKYSAGSNEDQARNLVVEGDNLQAMVTLCRERGQVDLVVTDPPFNTGNDFRYNDKWEEDPNDPGLGEFISADDGARHTKWMRFMWPRLQMMKSMLRPASHTTRTLTSMQLGCLSSLIGSIHALDRVCMS